MNNTLQVGKTGSTFVKSAVVVAQEGRKTVRRDNTGGIGFEVDLTISHQDIGSATSKSRRSLYRVDVNGDATDGSAVTESVMIIRQVPLKPGGSQLTVAQVASILSGLAENNSVGDLTSFCNGEI
jgi:hypothetical protein